MVWLFLLKVLGLNGLICTFFLSSPPPTVQAVPVWVIGCHPFISLWPSLPSSSSRHLTVISSRLSSMGSGAFSCFSPKLWNSLPPDTCNIFKSRLKACLFVYSLKVRQHLYCAQLFTKLAEHQFGNISSVSMHSFPKNSLPRHYRGWLSPKKQSHRRKLMRWRIEVRTRSSRIA